MKQDNKWAKKIFNILIWIAVILLLVFLYRRYSSDLDIFRDTEKMKDYILSFGQYSVLAFIVFQIIQVVVFFIPGEVVQVVGGYIFGPIIGSVVSIVGILLGSMISYYVAKLIGQKRINKLIEENNLVRLKRILEAGKNDVVIFAIYMIPGIPKDLLVYVAGISGVSFSEFMIFSSLGRAPWIFASALFGSGIGTGNYLGMIIIGVVSVLFFLIGILKGNKIIDYIHSKRHRK